jgi:predicted Zn-dependent protease
MADLVSARFHVRAVVAAPLALPTSAFRPTRGQYDADALLETLFDLLDPEVSRVVGVTRADLFAEGRNFVFGYAHMRDRVAVLSTLRLSETWWGRADDPAVYRARLDKALTHELGHTFHAVHCSQPRCVMHQVEFLWQLDQLDHDYCEACRERVARALARGPRDAETLFELAGSYMRRRRFERAVGAYAEAALAAPDDAHYHNDHGVALLAVGDRESAALAFERARVLRPESPYAWYNLGIVSRERGDMEEADRCFGEALTRDVDPRAGHRYLGILHQDYFRDPIRARRHFEAFRALGGEDVEVQRRLDALPVQSDKFLGV